MKYLTNLIENAATIFLDTAPVIYLVEQKEPFWQLAKPIFDRIDDGQLMAVTSAITVAECLYYPYKNDQTYLVEAFSQRLIYGRNVMYMPITAVIAQQSAALRAEYNLHLADALQIATALEAGCDLFLTNDRQLNRIDALSIIVLEDLQA